MNKQLAMKASELRIGNYLALPTRGEDVVIVEEIFANDFVVCDVTSNEWPIADYAPIPITEEWLLKLGFKEHDELAGYGIECGRMGIVIGNAQDDDFMFLFREDIGLNYEALVFIDYVHHLQNLYFALTGEELKMQ